VNVQKFKDKRNKTASVVYFVVKLVINILLRW